MNPVFTTVGSVSPGPRRGIRIVILVAPRGVLAWVYCGEHRQIIKIGNVMRGHVVRGRRYITSF